MILKEVKLATIKITPFTIYSYFHYILDLCRLNLTELVFFLVSLKLMTMYFKYLPVRIVS